MGSPALALWGGGDALPLSATWEHPREMGAELLADEPRYDVGGRFGPRPGEAYIHRLAARHSLWWGGLAARADLFSFAAVSDLDVTLNDLCEPLTEATHDLIDLLTRAIIAVLQYFDLLPSDQSWRLWPRIMDLCSERGTVPPIRPPRWGTVPIPEGGPRPRPGSAHYHPTPPYARAAGVRWVRGRVPPASPFIADALTKRPAKWRGRWPYAPEPYRAGPYLTGLPEQRQLREWLQAARFEYRLHGPKSRGWRRTKVRPLPRFRRSWTTRIAHAMLGGDEFDARLEARWVKILRRTWWLGPLRWYLLRGPAVPPANLPGDRAWAALVWGLYGSKWGAYDLGRPLPLNEAGLVPHPPLSTAPRRHVWWHPPGGLRPPRGANPQSPAPALPPLPPRPRGATEAGALAPGLWGREPCPQGPNSTGVRVPRPQTGGSRWLPTFWARSLPFCPPSDRWTRCQTPAPGGPSFGARGLSPAALWPPIQPWAA